MSRDVKWWQEDIFGITKPCGVATKHSSRLTADMTETEPLTLRIPVDVLNSFRGAASAEGMKNVQAWLLRTGQRRVHQLDEAIERGRYIVNADGLKVPFSDFDSTSFDEAEIVISNAEARFEELITEGSSIDQAGQDLWPWIEYAILHSKDVQSTLRRCRLLCSRLGDMYSELFGSLTKQVPKLVIVDTATGEETELEPE